MDSHPARWRKNDEAVCRAGARPARTAATAVMCGLILVGGTLLPPSALRDRLAAPAAAQASGERLITLQLAEADFHMVISQLQRQTGADIVVQDGARPFGKVNVSLTRASLAKALRYIALTAHATVNRDADGVYVIRPAGAADDLPSADTAPALTQTATLVTPVSDTAAGQTPAPTYHWQKLILQHAVPSQILKMLGWDNNYHATSPFDNLGNDLDTKITSSNTIIVPGNNGSYQQVPSVPIGRGNIGPAAANDTAQEANRSIEPGDTTSQAHQFPGQPGRPGGVGGAGQGGEGLPEGVRRVYAVEGDNSLLVYATADGFQELARLVKLLDIQPRQVNIKVEFITATVADVDQFGINFSLIPFPGTTYSFTQQAVGGGENLIQFAYGNLVAQLAATLSRTRGKVVQAPSITTSNNTPASVQIQNQIPYQQSTTVVPNGGQAVTSNSTSFLNISSGLTVLPRINADDTISLALSPQISDVGAPPLTGGAPPVTSERVQSYRTIRSGDTMVLGGFVRKGETQTQERVPFLADLPLVGSLFRNRNRNVSDTELLIFVTPTIVVDPDVGAGGTGTGTGAVNVTP